MYLIAYTIVPTITTGDVATAAWGNTHIKDNFAAGVPDLFTTDGDIAIGTGADAAERVNAFDSSNLLLHERGGLEADVNAVTTGDTLVGQSAGVIGLETAMSQAQAEAGSDTQVRGVTAQRINQAIQSLSSANIVTGTYTGDGATSQAITGVGFAVKYLMITRRITSAGALFNKEVTITTNIIVDDNAAGFAINLDDGSGGESGWVTDAIIALGSDGFTVDDAGANLEPNVSGGTYNYIAIG